MEANRPLACIQCGLILGVAGGRCPQCGAEQPEPGSALSMDPSTSLHARSSLGAPSPRVRVKPPNKALPWVVLGVGLAAIVVIGALLTPKQKDPPTAAAATESKPTAPTAAAAPVDPNDLGIADRKAVDPGDLLARAKVRAQRWNQDAVLVSMRATGVVAGKVDLTSGGAVEYWFGKPTGEGFAAGAHVAGKRLHVVVSGNPTTVDEAGGGGGRAASEPNCPIDEAARKAQAAGVGTSAPLTVVYEYSDKHKKAVYRVSASGDEAHGRVLDGQSCAILVR